VALRRYRQRALFTHEALAERAGTSAAAISALERGKRRRPYPDTVRRLADALDLSSDEREAFVALALTGRTADPGPVVDAPKPFGSRRVPLIGRDGDVARLVELTSMHPGRLVTLTGIGGGGKTRLALAVIDELRASFAGDAVVVELASVADAAQVPVAMAVALDIPEVAGEGVCGQLASALANRRLLLLLDNCEHVLEACADVAEQLLVACPGLVIVATSQEPLQLTRELPWRVPMLAAPDVDDVVAPADLADLPAVQLFLARAVAAQPGFELTEGNHTAVAQICARLGGHPLALELAAARVHVLSVQQILGRLDDAVALLAGGRSSAPARQQTLRATLTWSYTLLTGSEQAVLRRLAVCVGGCEIEAAEAICSGDDVPKADVLDVVGRLVHRSLVTVDEVDGIAYYRLLEPVRQFLAGMMVDAERREALRRHASAYEALAQRVAPAIHGPDQARLLRLLERESANLRAALSWMAAAGEVERALRLAVTLSPFWEAHGHLDEGRRWISDLLEQGANAASTAAAQRDRDGSALRLQALLAAGRLAYWQKLLDESATLLEAVIAEARRSGDQRSLAEALAYLGAGRGHRGAFAEGSELLEESLALARAADDPVGIALGLLTSGVTKSFVGEHDRAVAMVTDSVARYRRLGDARWTAIALTMLSGVFLQAGEPGSAVAPLRDGLSGHLAIGDRGFMVSGLDHLAAGLAAEGRLVETARVLGAMAALSRVMGAAPSTVTEGILVQIEAAVRGQLSADDYRAAWDEGRSRPLSEVVSRALQELRAEPEGARPG
jgi:predicted ATPase/transcriptional regulator with XRE-family HTH domain